MKIYAPNPEYTGVSTFGDTVLTYEDGVATHEGDLPASVRQYLLGAGYGVGAKLKAADEPEALEVADPRDQTLEQVGSPLRDAAVNPRPGDYLAPTNAGKEGPEGNPHGPTVVSPELHAGGVGAVVPGPVGRLEHQTVPDPTAEDPDATKVVPVVVSDTEAQEARERELSDRTRIDGEPVPDVVADIGQPPAPAHTPDEGEPKGNASRADWVAYARTKGAPEAELAELGTEGALSRDDLHAAYGS